MAAYWLLSMSAVFVLVACGGGSSSKLTAAQWQKDASTICNRSGVRAGHAMAGLANIRNPAEVATYLRAASSTIRKMDQQLRGLNGPGSLVVAARAATSDNETTAAAETSAADQFARLPAGRPLTDAEFQRLTAPVQAAQNRVQLHAATGSLPLSCSPTY
jgi:hypothetical protein